MGPFRLKGRGCFGAAPIIACVCDHAADDKCKNERNGIGHCADHPEAVVETVQVLNQSAAPASVWDEPAECDCRIKTQSSNPDWLAGRSGRNRREPLASKGDSLASDCRPAAGSYQCATTCGPASWSRPTTISRWLGR